jgi:tRNA-modifying protein YgfZ
MVMTTDLEHRRSGAVYSEGVDHDVPWHYGDPFREQRQLAEDVGIVDRGNRGVLTVTGEDRLAWLHSICSQHVAELGEGDSTESLVLSPHGHVEQHWVVTEVGGAVWIDTEPGAASGVLDYLQKMRFLKRVEPTDVSDDWSVYSLVGPACGQALAAAGFSAPEPRHAVSLADGGFVRRSWWSPDAADLIVPRAQAEETWAALVGAGLRPAGLWAYEALRVAARRPRLGFETDHRTIPHELGWIGAAVHLDKGCYRGQETVARVHNLGRPPRRLVLLHLSGETDELPDAGAPIELEGRTVGFLGTAVQHCELGPIALAVVKRTISGIAPLMVSGFSAAIDDVDS